MSIDDSITPTGQDAQASLVKLMQVPWAELEALEHDNRLFFPDVVLKRRVDGALEETQVALCVPRPDELRWARTKARALALKADLDLDRDAEMVEDMENIHILSRAIRNITTPHEPWEPDPTLLERNYDRRSLAQMWAKLDALTNFIDPRPSDLSKEEVLAVIAAISKTREVYPLHVLGPHSQTSCIVSMADLALSFLASKSLPDASDS